MSCAITTVNKFFQVISLISFVFVISAKGIKVSDTSDLINGASTQTESRNPLFGNFGNFGFGSLGGLAGLGGGLTRPGFIGGRPPLSSLNELNFQEGRRCPLCDSSVYSYCSDRLLHDACCCNPQDPSLPYQCRFADCSFLHANSCREHRLITACCCNSLYLRNAP